MELGEGGLSFDSQAARLTQRAMNSKSTMAPRKWVWLAILALALLHHDFWFWADAGLIWGFLPMGLAYHMGFSLAAAGLWVVVMKFAWPHELEEWASKQEETKPRP